MADDNDLLQAWATAKAELAEAKMVELDLRNKIISMVATKKEGSENVKFAGQNLRVTSVTHYSVNRLELESIYQDLNDYETAAVRFRPEIVLGEYKKLPPDSMLRYVVTATPGQGQLELK